MKKHICALTVLLFLSFLAITGCLIVTPPSGPVGTEICFLNLIPTHGECGIDIFLKVDGEVRHEEHLDRTGNPCIAIPDKFEPGDLIIIEAEGYWLGVCGGKLLNLHGAFYVRGE